METGKDHTLAEELWSSGIHEARILACLIDVLEKVNEEKEEFVKRAGFVMMATLAVHDKMVFLNKNKPEERKGKVLFINASSEFEQHPEVRKLNKLGEANIQKIADAYKISDGGDGFVRAVSLDEIKNNDYNLNVTLYVFPQEVAEEIDVEKEWQELRMIEEEIAGVEVKIEGYLKEIG